MGRKKKKRKPASFRKSQKAKFKNEKKHRPSNHVEVTGLFQATRRGFGFVKVDPQFAQKEDIFIPPRLVGAGLSGDRVRVKILRESPWSKERNKKKSPSGETLGPRGEIIQVIERSTQPIVGVLCSHESFFFVEVRKDGFPIIGIPFANVKESKAQVGDLVTVKITRYSSSGRNDPQGQILEILGARGDPRAEERAVILKHGLQEGYPQQVLVEAESFPNKISASDVQGRKDLRDKLFFTIDGDSARDFDDAVCIEKTTQGFYRLSVAIADVSHYIKSNSPMDMEAYRRATSVYFPTRALHMLPEKLSAGLCSLVPHQDRLVMVAEMVFDERGEKKDNHFYEAVICSHARLTYAEVAKVLESPHFLPVDPQRCPITDAKLRGDISFHLKIMSELQTLLLALRKKRGSLDFDMPEAELIFEGEESAYSVENIIRGERLLSHRLVEEFMIAANEAVAEFLTQAHWPIPYRIHEPPDPLKIQDFIKMVSKIPEVLPMIKGLNEGSFEEPGVLAKILTQIQGLPEARLVNISLLTSLKLAIYHTVNRGHFGLASPCYGHFTSPIRRYPDLMLHRQLKDYLQRKNQGIPITQLQESCDHCSAQEQVAVAAEREMIQFYKVLFMRQRLGEIYEGQIVKVTAHGFFIELASFMVDGFLPLEDLPEDDYIIKVDQQAILGRNQEYRLSDSLRVHVAQADLDSRRITFGLAEGT